MRANRRHSPLRLLAAVVLVSGLTPAALGERDPSFRAFWADAFHVGFKSQSQIDDMIDRALIGNYNAIVPEVLAYQDYSNTYGGHKYNTFHLTDRD